MLAEPRRKVTLLDLDRKFKNKEKLAVMTAYDYASATFVEQAGNIDMCLVGDSLAMVSCGYQSTVQLGMEEMLFHCRSVARGAKTPFLVADMPFGSYHVSVKDSVSNAIRMITEGNMEAVKMEGSSDQVVTPVIRQLSEIGIPVMAHVGLKPQTHVATSGFRVQGKTAESALQVYKDALAVQEAGAFSVVLEAIPARLGAFISSRLSIPTIGIGAGPGCSGQVLVMLDMLGGFDRFLPRFCRKYMDLSGDATRSVRTYAQEVQDGRFPDEKEHAYPISDEEWQHFAELAQHIKSASP